MGTMIHARRRKDGWRYRIWSTVVDAYIVPEMTQQQIVRFDILRQLERSISSLGIETPSRFTRAHEHGTSGYDDSATDVDGAWEEQRDEWEDDDPTEDAEPYIGGGRVFYLEANPIKHERFLVDGKAVKITITVDLVDEEDT